MIAHAKAKQIACKMQKTIATTVEKAKKLLNSSIKQVKDNFLLFLWLILILLLFGRLQVAYNARDAKQKLNMHFGLMYIGKEFGFVFAISFNRLGYNACCCGATVKPQQNHICIYTAYYTKIPNITLYYKVQIRSL